MNNPDNLQPMGTQSQETLDLTAAKARNVLDSAGRTADRVVDKIADRAEDAKKDARQVLNEAAGVADFVADKAAENLDRPRSPFGDRLASYSDEVANFTAAEPVKAMLIAATAGAVLMALLSMTVASRD